MEWILNAMESEPSANACAISKKISLLDIILTVDQVWRAVKSDEIVNCWRKGEREREREICLFASNFFNKLPLKTQKKTIILHFEIKTN